MKIKRLYVIGIPNFDTIMEYGSRYRFFEKWSKEVLATVKYLDPNISLRTEQEKLKEALRNDLVEFKPDSIFIYSNYPSAIFDVLMEHKKEARVIFWHCDWSNLKERWGEYYRKKPPVDFLFVVSAGHVEMYKKDLDILVSYLPHEFANDFDNPIVDESFKSDVAFVGQCAPWISKKYYEDRKRFIQYLISKKCGLRTFPDMSDVSEQNYADEYSKRFHKNQKNDLAKMYGSGKIFLGIETKQIHETFCYFSNRPFITMGYGSFYLCWKSSGIEKIFRIGEHLDVFSSFEEGYEKILFYLSNDKLRNQIASNSRKLVYEKHLTEHRCKDLITTVETETPTFSGWLK